MEIPYVLILKSKGQTVDKAKKLIQFCQQKDTVINKIDPDITVRRSKSTKENKMEEGHEIQCSNKLQSDWLCNDSCKIRLYV